MSHSALIHYATCFVTVRTLPELVITYCISWYLAVITDILYRKLQVDKVLQYNERRKQVRIIRTVRTVPLRTRLYSDLYPTRISGYRSEYSLNLTGVQADNLLA